MLFLIRLVFLVQSRQIDSLVFRQRDKGLLSFSNHEDVAQSGGKVLSIRVLHMHDVESSQVSFPVHDHSHSPDVISSGDVAQVLDVQLHIVHHLASRQVHLDCIMHINFGMGIPNGSCVVGDNVGDLVWSNFLLDDSANLSFGIFGLDWDKSELSFDIVHDPVVFIGLVDGNDVHHACWESMVSSHFPIDLHIAVLVV